MATRQLRKRKDRDVIAVAAHSDPGPISVAKADPAPPSTAPPQQIPATGGSRGEKLLAGYLAHEFLTKGTLFGRRWDPAAAAVERPEGQEEWKQTLPRGAEEEKGPTAAAAYTEVAYLLKADGGGVPGVVNPTQLLRWLQM